MNRNELKGQVGSIRQIALDWRLLAKMERHGKREDATSKQRSLSNIKPFVFGSLDLRDSRAKHMEGIKQSGKSACIHAIVQYPTNLIDRSDSEKQKWMLDHAVSFINKFHGGDAVFAARIDRDERGGHNVDVFAMPRYDFQYKNGKVIKKASISKFSKAEAAARYIKICPRTQNPLLDSEGHTIPRMDPRAQGSALQDAWFEYLKEILDLPVKRPNRKKATARDRVEPEVYALNADRTKFNVYVSQQMSQLKYFGELIKRRTKEIVKSQSNLVAAEVSFEKIKKDAIPALQAAQNIATANLDLKLTHTIGLFIEKLKRSRSERHHPKR